MIWRLTNPTRKRGLRLRVLKLRQTDVLDSNRLDSPSPKHTWICYSTHVATNSFHSNTPHPYRKWRRRGDAFGVHAGRWRVATWGHIGLASTIAEFVGQSILPWVPWLGGCHSRNFNLRQLGPSLARRVYLAEFLEAECEEPV